MPVWIPAPVLGIVLAAQGPATPTREPVVVAGELLVHDEMRDNEFLAVSEIRTAIRAAHSSSPPPPGVRSKGGYRIDIRPGVFIAVPARVGYGLHGFCGDTQGRVCYTPDGGEPEVTGGRCAPSCRDLPSDWLDTLLPAPRFSAEERAGLEAALDAGALFPDYPDAQERVRALMRFNSPASPSPGRAHGSSAAGLAFTGDGAALLTTSFEDSRVTLWSTASRQPLARLTACDSAFDVAVAADGSTAVTACRTAVKTWSLPDLRAQAGFGRFDAISIDVSLDRSGRTLAAVARERALVWQLPGGRQLASITLGAPRDVVQGHGTLTPDATRLVTGGLGQPTRVWALPQGTLEATLEEGTRNSVSGFAVSDDGRTLAAGYRDGSVAAWSLPDGRLIARRHEHGAVVGGVALSSDGRRLVSGSSDTSVKVWSLPDLTVRRTLRGHADEVYAVAVSSSGVIASGDRAGVVLLWDLTTGALKGPLVDPSRRDAPAAARRQSAPRP
jgi:hypothetical protein